MALRRSRAAHVLVRLPLAGPRAVPLGPRVLGGRHRRRPHRDARGGRRLHRARRRSREPARPPAAAHGVQPAHQLRRRHAGHRRSAVGARRGRGAGHAEPERPGGGPVLAGGAGAAAGDGRPPGADPGLRLVQRGRLRPRGARVAGRGRMAEGGGRAGPVRARRVPGAAVVLRRRRHRARPHLPAAVAGRRGERSANPGRAHGPAPLARDRARDGRPAGPRLPRRRLHRAEPARLLVPSALRSGSRRARAAVLRHQPALGGLVPGRRARGRPRGPAEHDGLLAPALERAAVPGAAGSVVPAGGGAAAGAAPAVADGRADAPGLHDGPRRPRREAGRGGVHDERARPRPGGGARDHRRGPAARGVGVAVLPRRRPEDRLRSGPVLPLPEGAAPGQGN